MKRTRNCLASAVCVSFAFGLIACPSTQPPRKTATPDRPAARPDSAEASVWEHVKDGDAKVRLGAVTELTNLGSARALKILVTLTADPDATVRAAAEAGLVRRGTAAAGVLVEVLKTVSDDKVAPIEALLVRLGKRAVGPLMHALGGAPQGAKRAAAVIGKMKGGRLAIFAHVLRRGGKVARLVAARQLAAIGTDAARLALVPGLAIWNEKIRTIARKTLKPHFVNKEITTAILQVFKTAGFWQAYALSLSVYDHPDTRVHNEIVYGFHTARRTYDRHALFSSLVVRGDVWYGRIVDGILHPAPRARNHILKALWFEVSSLRRIQTAAKAHRDTAQLKWSSGELRQLKKALKKKAIRKALKALTGKLEPYPAWRAAYLLKFAGGRVNLNNLRKKYIAGLNKILEQSPEKVGVDSILAAYVRLGDDAWKRSCPVDPVNGVCVQIKNKKTRAGWRRTVRYRKRNAKLVAQAQAHLSKAWSFWADGAMLDRIPAKDPRRKARRMRARHYAAWAKWMKAEFRLEAFLQSRPPANLNFDPTKPKLAKASRQRFNAWFGPRYKEAAAMVKDFLTTITKARAAKTDGAYKRSSMYWSVGAVSRAGAVYEHLGTTLRSTPLPKNLKSIAARDAFRKQMDKAAKPLLSRAANTYVICLSLARRFRWHWEWALICESGLARTNLRRFRIQAKRHRYTRAPLPGAGYPHLQMLELMLNSKLTSLRKCGTIKKGTKYKVTLTPQGRVTQAAPTGRNKPQGKADTCIRSLLQSLVLPPFRGKTAKLTLTLP